MHIERNRASEVSDIRKSSSQASYTKLASLKMKLGNSNFEDFHSVMVEKVILILWVSNTMLSQNNKRNFSNGLDKVQSSKIYTQHLQTSLNVFVFQ